MTNNRPLAHWLLAVSALIVILVIFGGWVRLTRSGLSITEWNVVTGVVPPLSDQAWESEFAKYRQTPEYRIVNYGMGLDQFKFIYYMEFGHRFLGRVAGLLFVLPLFYFLLYTGRALSLKNRSFFPGEFELSSSNTNSPLNGAFLNWACNFFKLLRKILSLGWVRFIQRTAGVF